MKPPKIKLSEEFQMPKNPRIDAIVEDIKRTFDNFDFKDATRIKWQQPEIHIDLRINKTSYLKTPDGAVHILGDGKRE